MRYWAWPPDYDWINMADRVTDTSPQVQKDAVARLCRDIGDEAGATYCSDNKCQTSAYFAGYIGKDLLDTFEDHFYYSNDADGDERDNDSVSSWFSKIQDQLNANRPLPYMVDNHVIVCDGWQIVGSVKQYHMNYGWDDGTHEDCTCNPCNAWYTLDELCLGDRDIEEMLVRVYPAPSLGTWLSGDPPDDPVEYGVPFPLPIIYRYFDQNATGRNVTFAAGHQLQFLPGVSVRGTSPIGDCIRFVGGPDLLRITRLFSIKGTKTGGSDAGIKIYNGGIRLYNTGGIKFH